MIISPLVVGHGLSSLPEDYKHTQCNTHSNIHTKNTHTTKRNTLQLQQTELQNKTIKLTTIHYVTNKKWLCNLLENVAADNRGLSNIKFAKLFHQDVADEQKKFSNDMLAKCVGVHVV